MGGWIGGDDTGNVRIYSGYLHYWLLRDKDTEV